MSDNTCMQNRSFPHFVFIESNPRNEFPMVMKDYSMVVQMMDLIVFSFQVWMPYKLVV